MSLDKIDTSYWLTKDKDWVADRKAKWEIIEPMLVGPKSCKGKTAIKQYFLKGKMPDWDKFRDWNNDERHVDIFMFLWLHPSCDEKVLTQLRNEYIASDVIVYDDIKSGFEIFLSWGTVRACEDYSDEDPEYLKNVLHTAGLNESLFRVLMGDLDQLFLDLEFLDTGLGRENRLFKKPNFELDAICLMGDWLNIKKMGMVNNDMLLQYDMPLEWWYMSCPKEENYFSLNNMHKRQIPYIEKALYRIHHFDTEKEGDTCRTRFVHKIRKILDERDFIPEFKQMWEDVKTDKIEVKDPWKR